MSVLNSNLYDKLLKFNIIYNAIDNKVCLNGIDWDTAVDNAKSSSLFYIGKLGLGYYEKLEVKFLVLASYLTYIPYGRLGYKFLEEMNVNVAEYRYNKLTGIMGDDLLKLPDEQNKYIKDFFVNYNKEEIDLKDVREAVSLVIRGHNELEAISTLDCMKFKNKSSELIYMLSDLPKTIDKIKISEALKEHYFKQELTLEEKEYILKITKIDG